MGEDAPDVKISSAVREYKRLAERAESIETELRDIADRMVGLRQFIALGHTLFDVDVPSEFKPPSKNKKRQRRLVEKSSAVRRASADGAVTRKDNRVHSAKIRRAGSPASRSPERGHAGGISADGFRSRPELGTRDAAIEVLRNFGGDDEGLTILDVHRYMELIGWSTPSEDPGALVRRMLYRLVDEEPRVIKEGRGRFRWDRDRPAPNERHDDRAALE